jgi:ADP-heptose:LPS heptosyltransferase
MVMLTLLLNLLHQRYRLPCQVIGTGSWTEAIYRGNPDVAGVWSFHRHLPFLFDRHWLSVRRALRDSAPGPVYICERHYRQLPRIRRMLRLSGVDMRRCVFIAQETTAERQQPQHLIDRLMNLGALTPPALLATDYPLPAPPQLDGPRLHVLDAEQTERDAWLHEQGWYGRELILVQPGNHRTMGPRRARWRRLNSDDKWWPLERWAALLHKIHDCRNDALLVLRGSREEVPMLEEIRAATGLANVVVVGNGLRQFFALCEVAHSVISVDSGPAHAAAALSAPLLVLYGVHSPSHWLPRSPSGSAVASVGGPPVCTRIDQISVDAVFEAWRSLEQ